MIISFSRELPWLSLEVLLSRIPSAGTEQPGYYATGTTVVSVWLQYNNLDQFCLCSQASFSWARGVPHPRYYDWKVRTPTFEWRMRDWEFTSRLYDYD